MACTHCAHSVHGVRALCPQRPRRALRHGANAMLAPCICVPAMHGRCSHVVIMHSVFTRGDHAQCVHYRPIFMNAHTHTHGVHVECARYAHGPRKRTHEERAWCEHCAPVGVN
eukprot:364213-Chlamydomonas_euryale.AAC.16